MDRITKQLIRVVSSAQLSSWENSLGGVESYVIRFRDWYVYLTLTRHEQYCLTVKRCEDSCGFVVYEEYFGGRMCYLASDNNDHYDTLDQCFKNIKSYRRTADRADDLLMDLSSDLDNWEEQGK